MDDWVARAMARWPNVPALFGWLGLDRRGTWLIKGEAIRHPRIVETINRNYGADQHGRWYFQNGPQRGYITLASAPFVLRVSDDAQTLATHTGLRVEHPTGAYLDEDGALVLATEHGPGEVAGADLEWMLQRLLHSGAPAEEGDVEAALAAPAGALTPLALDLYGVTLPILRLDFSQAPQQLGFVREPTPSPGERSSSDAPD